MMNPIEFCSATLDKDNLKLECLSNFCQCCLSENNLRRMSPQTNDDSSYLDILFNCFSLQVANNELFGDSQYLICDDCATKLKECHSFRCQIEDSQSKLKEVYARNSIFAISSISGDCTQESDDNIFKAEYISEDDIQSTFDEIANIGIEFQNKKKGSKKSPNEKTIKNPNKKMKLRRRKNAQIVEKPTSISKDAYSTAVENLLNPGENEESKSEKGRINMKTMSKEDLLNYKRVYNRFRYAKAIPFKLDESALTCHLCNETFSTHKFLVSHMAIHYPNHICDLCGKSFVLRTHLAGHIRTHSLEKISCSICHKLLKKSSMNRHLKIHTGLNGVYACPHCPQRFVSFSTRVNHMAECHNVDIFKYNCKICAKKFHLASSLSKHVRRCHFQELNVTCEECGKGFFDKKSLNEHMLKHTGEKKFQCEICFKSYARRCTIREHMKIHNNIKQHECPICDRSFTQKCTLKGHMKMHEKSIQSSEEM